MVLESDPHPRKAAILLVEDDHDLAQMFGQGLFLAGHEVVSAGDGCVAFALASRMPFDLVLLDVHLPRINGIEALSMLRSQPETRDLPVVMFTNSEDDGVLRSAQSLGISGWLVKSRITPGELARRIEFWLDPPAPFGRPALQVWPDVEWRPPAA